jgi:Domain of Unknown Function (DUF748)
MTRKWWVWLVGSIGGLIVGAVALSFFIDEPLRRYAERQLNTHLKGYTVRLGRLDLHPLQFSVDLYDVSIVQDANPEPPIVFIPRLRSGMHGRALLSAHLVGDVHVEQPKVHINLKQLREEAADDVPLQERGWQEAVQAVSPLKVNLLRVVDGVVTYVDEAPFEPLHLTQLNLRAENIRNVQSQAWEYPSPIQMQAVIFESGKVWLDGHADFLAVPHVALKAQLGLEQVDLAYVKPVARRYNVVLRAGTLSGTGGLEFTPNSKVAHLQTATVRGLRMDYIYFGPTTETGPEKAREVTRATQEMSNHPTITLRADTIAIIESEIGFVNKAATPNYRLFLTGLEIHLTNFSNQLAEGVMVVRLSGKFMGSGQTVLGATFRPETDGPDFALAASIENTDMQTMNPVLRAHGNFDVVRGFFSVYTEMRVKNAAVQGYVKPLFKEMDVYDPRQDQEKNLFQKIYEGLVGGVSQLLENVPRQEVATKADISSPLENPQASTWQVLVNLIQNATLQAILPGFEREVGRSQR